MSEAHVRTLKRARDKIASGNERYVCYALTYCGVYTSSALDIRDAIDAALGDCPTVLSWLSKTLGSSAYAFSSHEMRAYRLLWIDNMIEYWRDK